MQEAHGEFEKRNTVVVAIAQEDKDLDSHGKILSKLSSVPRFKIVADLRGRTVGHYDRTSVYLLDRAGIVRQVFPMLIHTRGSWKAVLNEIDRLGLGGQ